MKTFKKEIFFTPWARKFKTNQIINQFYENVTYPPHDRPYSHQNLRYLV